MNADQPTLALLERAAVAEEVRSALRHDLRNKLASIRNAAFYLRRRVERTEVFETDARVPLFFKLIEDELMAAEQVTSENMPLGHLFGTGIAPTRVEQLVGAALELAVVPAGIHVDRSLAKTRPIVASGREITLLIRSLIDNAIEAMPDGGTLLVRTSSVDGAAVLEVADSGGGISAEDRVRALEPFVTAKRGHLGIGMNVAKRIAERYAGKITVESPGRGTVVRVEFRRAPPAKDLP